MLDKMCEDIWKFLQPKMDQKFEEMKRRLDAQDLALDRIEAALKK